MSTVLEEVTTAPQLAKRWKINVDKVLGFIRSGELRSLNLAKDRNGRPRYKILLSDVQKFEESRQTKPAIQQPRRRRRRRTAAGKDYFE